MKTLSKDESRKVNGGFVFTTGMLYGLAALGGARKGIQMTIDREHKKYGHCRTYGLTHRIFGKLIANYGSNGACY